MIVYTEDVIILMIFIIKYLYYVDTEHNNCYLFLLNHSYIIMLIKFAFYINIFFF